jgi:hypothetical protein
MAILLLVLIVPFTAFGQKDRSRAHAPYEVGTFEKKSQIVDGRDSRTWVWTVSVGDTVYDLRGAYGDKWLSELPVGSKVEIAIGGKHHDEAWIHFDGKNVEAAFVIIGTSVRPRP